MEDPGGSGGTNPGGKWNYVAAPDAEGNQSNFQGDGYYLYGSSSSTALQGPAANETLEYTILVPEGETGIYQFAARVARDGDAASDQQNDLWLNIKPADQPGTGDLAEDFLVIGNNEPEPVNDGFIKVFGGPNTGSWGTARNYDALPNNPPVRLNIDEPGLYTVQIAGRSQGYHVDSFELFKGSKPAAGASDSRFVEDDPGTGGGGGGTGGGTGGEIVIPIDATTDDDEIFGPFGSDDLEFGVNNGEVGRVGLRFDDITIPQGATIEQAFIRFQSDGNDDSAIDMLIEIEGTEAAVTYSTGSTPDDRTYADSFVWQDVEAWAANQVYRTPDLTALVQGVIGSDGIADGALAFRISGVDGTTGRRSAYSFDSDGDAPELVIVLAGDDGL